MKGLAQNYEARDILDLKRKSTDSSSLRRASEGSRGKGTRIRVLDAIRCCGRQRSGSWEGSD